MRHATSPDDIARLEPLLVLLRTIPQLRERKAGSFTFRSRGLIHFHEHHGEFFADARLGDDYERWPVNSGDDRDAFVSAVRRFVGDGHAG
jgi:hypothetical protein